MKVSDFSLEKKEHWSYGPKQEMVPILHIPSETDSSDL